MVGNRRLRQGEPLRELGNVQALLRKDRYDLLPGRVRQRSQTSLEETKVDSIYWLLDSG